MKAAGMLARVLSAVLLAAAGSVWAAAPARLDQPQNDVRDIVSLQSGARSFVNYCLNCHPAAMMRYNRLADLGLTEEQIRDNLMFTADKTGEVMNSALSRKDGKEWFGVAAPDLTVIARARGGDWLYTYLRTFYRDPSTTTGWNNLIFDRVAMPHVLWHLSGESTLEVSEFKTPREAEAARTQAKTFAVVVEQGEGDAKRYLVRKLRMETPGSMTPAQYDGMVRDLVNFLVWMGEPAQQTRVRIGIVVLLILAVLMFLSWLLYKEYWKDVH